MDKNNFPENYRPKTKQRLTAILVAVVFVLASTFVPAQMYAAETETMTETEDAAMDAVTEEPVQEETAVPEKLAESEEPAGPEEPAEILTSDLSDLVLVTDENGDSIDISEVDEAEYEGFLYKLEDDVTKKEIKEMKNAAEEVGGSQEISEVVENEIYEADSLETIEEVASEDIIEYIEPNYVVRALEAETSDPAYESSGWYLDMTHTPFMWSQGMFGQGTTIAILDSGVKTDHPDLDNITYVARYNTINGSTEITDNIGHGTSVTGVVAAEYDNGEGLTGIVPEAEIMPIKTMDYDETTKETTGTVANVIKAIDYAVDKGADVINMSLGTEGYNLALKNACDKAAARGVILVAAAGNEAQMGNPAEYPASFDSVVSVGSVGRDGAHSYFSNYNNKVYVTAPGESLYMPYIGEKKKYAESTGTSFSTPQVSAMAAMVKSLDPSVDCVGFMQVIRGSAVDKGTAGYDNYYGYGLMDLERAYRYMKGDMALLQTSLSVSSYDYDGTAKMPFVTVKKANKTVNKNNYAVTYSSGRTKVGTYQVTITGKNECVGTRTLSFKIVPHLVKGIKSPIRYKKSIKVRWKAMSKAQKTKYKGTITGYQVRVAKNSKFTNAKYVSVKGKSKTSAKVTKLKRKTNYYVQYRAYKTVGSTTYYSKWSSTKKVKTQ